MATLTSLGVDTYEGNPIGELVETTQRLSLGAPIYEFEESSGPAHNRVFVCHVKFGDFKETGYAKTKKLAKRQAAIKMIDNLKSFSYLSTESNTNGKTLLKDKSRQQQQPRKANIFTSFTKLRLSVKPTMKKILESQVIETFSLNKKCLETLAEEENFEFKYHQLQPQQQKSADGKLNLFFLKDKCYFYKRMLSENLKMSTRWLTD